MIKVNLTGFNGEQEAKLRKALDIGFRVWASLEFKEAVLKARFTQTKDSSATIYKNITANVNGPTNFVTWNISLNKIANGSETAATTPATGEMTIQVLYLDKCSILELVNTCMHEMSHCYFCGSYTHSYLYNRWLPYLKLRPWSVGYQIGDICERLGKKYL